MAASLNLWINLIIKVTKKSSVICLISLQDFVFSKTLSPLTGCVCVLDVHTSIQLGCKCHPLYVIVG